MSAFQILMTILLPLMVWQDIKILRKMAAFKKLRNDMKLLLEDQMKRTDEHKELFTADELSFLKEMRDEIIDDNKFYQRHDNNYKKLRIFNFSLIAFLCLEDFVKSQLVVTEAHQNIVAGAANLPAEFEEEIDFGFEIEDMSLAEAGVHANSKIAQLFCRRLKGELDKLPIGQKGIRVPKPKMVIPITSVERNWKILFPNNPVRISAIKTLKKEIIRYRFWLQLNIR